MTGKQTYWTTIKSQFDRNALKESALLVAAYAGYFIGAVVFSIIWNYDQGESVMWTLSTFYTRLDGYILTTFPAFVVGMIVYDRLSDSGGLKD